LCYIHLNPLSSRIVDDIKALDTYAFSGHSYLMGRRKQNDWQSTDQVLALFGDQVPMARRRYCEYIKKGIDQG
jgi:hypothetical protein